MKKPPKEKCTCPHCAGLIPDGSVTGWAQLVLKSEPRQIAKELELVVQPAPALTKDRISELAPVLYKEAFSNGAIAELKALGHLNFDLMVEAIYGAGIIHGAMAARHLLMGGEYAWSKYHK